MAVFTFRQSNYLKPVFVVALNVTITRARTLVHSSVLPRLLLQHVLYIDKWVHSLQRGLPLYRWWPQRELRAWSEGGQTDSPHFESPWMGGGREPAALSGNLQVAKLFKALLSTLGCPLWPHRGHCLALQGNGEGSRAFCIVVEGSRVQTRMTAIPQGAVGVKTRHKGEPGELSSDTWEKQSSRKI